jgi:hypothetical protein
VSIFEKRFLAEVDLVSTLSSVVPKITSRQLFGIDNSARMLDWMTSPVWVGTYLFEWGPTCLSGDLQYLFEWGPTVPVWVGTYSACLSGDLQCLFEWGPTVPVWVGTYSTCLSVDLPVWVGTYSTCLSGDLQYLFECGPTCLSGDPGQRIGKGAVYIGRLFSLVEGTRSN